MVAMALYLLRCSAKRLIADFTVCLIQDWWQDPAHPLHLTRLDLVGLAQDRRERRESLLLDLYSSF